MNGFNKRYFLLISLTFLAFLGFALNYNPIVWWIVFALLLTLLIVICRKIKHKNKNFKTIIILLLIASVAGVGRAELFKYQNDALQKYSGPHTVTGYVKEISSSYPYMSERVVHIDSVDFESASFDAVLYTEFPSDMSVGDRFECLAELIPLSDYEDKEFLRNGVARDYPFVCVADGEEDLVISGREESVNTLLSRLNSTLSARLISTLGNKNGSLASALLLGNRDLLDNATIRDFKRAGAYHMLALSGLHVAILVGLLDFVLKRVGARLYIRLATLTVSTLFYVALTGFSLSACRAMLMLFMVYLANLLRTRSDAMTSLFAAMSIICLISPLSLFDLGLQLSFISTLGVICSSIVCQKIPFLNNVKKATDIKMRLLGLLRAIIRLGIASICVFILTLPLIMTYFGEVSLATFVTNLFMGAICEIFMVCSVLSLIFGGLFAYSAAIFGNIMTALTGVASSIEGVMLSLEYPNIEYLVWGLLALSLLLFAVKLKREWMIALPSVAFIVLLCVNVSVFNTSREGSVSVEYLQDDIIVLSSNDGIYICDASNGRFRNFYDGYELAKEGTFTELDGVILTHYHSYHATSIDRLADTCILRSVYLPKPISEKEAMVMASIFYSLEDTSTKIYMYETNSPLNILGGELVISDRAYFGGYSHPSVALTYSYGEKRITLIENPYFDTYLEESGELEEYIRESDVVIFGSDGRAPEGRYEVFHSMKNGAEIVFTSREAMILSDFEPYIENFKIYVDVFYKKYELK